MAVNYGRTENVSGEFVELERVSSGEEFVCVFETDVLTVEFSAPLDEQNVDTERYNTSHLCMYVHYVWLILQF